MATAQNNILLVEDTPSLSMMYRTVLERAGHAVDAAFLAEDARRAHLGSTGRLVLLDLMLPDGDGRVFLEEHREAQKSTPIIVTTARSAVSDRVGLLDLGADDYITKPFDFSELEARCRAVLRRRGGVASNAVSFADAELDSTVTSTDAMGTGSNAVPSVVFQRLRNPNMAITATISVISESVK